MGIPARAPCSLKVDAPDISSDAYLAILKILKRLRGFDLGRYKDKCVSRRIAIRIRKTGCTSAGEYGELLQRDAAEPDLLVKVLTIHVSQFFRNPSTFEKLKNEIVPYLISRGAHERRHTLNLWSVGCAGGEEPYSISLLLKEHFAPLLAHTRVAILGTDVDREVLAQAENGRYRGERLSDVPPATRERWFTREGDHYRLDREIRTMVTFRHHDLFDPGVMPDNDLILCRNVLIYLEREHQENILRRFAESLRGGGVLVLGKSETLVGESRRLFQTICPAERIYRAI